MPVTLTTSLTIVKCAKSWLNLPSVTTVNVAYGKVAASQCRAGAPRKGCGLAIFSSILCISRSLSTRHCLLELRSCHAPQTELSNTNGTHKWTQMACTPMSSSTVDLITLRLQSVRQVSGHRNTFSPHLVSPVSVFSLTTSMASNNIQMFRRSM